MIDIRDALTRAAGQLAAHPDLRPTAVADATLLFLHYLSIDRAALIAHPERPLNREQQADLQRLVERRLRFEPIQYITGTQEFYGLPLHVTPAVLIPRPETELLVEAVLTHFRVPHPREGSIVAGWGIGHSPTGLRIADIGTGSGAIAIALAHHLPHSQITALDLSPEALAIAQQNAQTHALADRIRFLQSDLLAAVATEEAFDAIISNPPYIPTSEAQTLHPQVRDFEPAQALFAGPDGLEIYARLIPQAHALLKPNGLLALEIGHGQQPAIAALLRDWHEVTFLPDLQQIPRVALALR
jgi:release factor glutamine methyltransferase